MHHELYGYYGRQGRISHNSCSNSCSRSLSQQSCFRMHSWRVLHRKCAHSIRCLCCSLETIWNNFLFNSWIKKYFFFKLPVYPLFSGSPISFSINSSSGERLPRPVLHCEHLHMVTCEPFICMEKVNAGSLSLERNFAHFLMSSSEMPKGTTIRGGYVSQYSFWELSRYL